MRKLFSIILLFTMLTPSHGAFRKQRSGYPGISPVINWDAPLNKGLVYWSLTTQLGGGTLFDLVRKNNGVLTSGPSWFGTNTHPGGYGELVYVGGTLTALPTSFQMPTKALTVSAWFYINNSLGGGFDSLAFRIDKAPNYHLFDFYLCYSGDGNGYFGWYNNAETRIIISPAALGLASNTWQFITYTWTAGGSHAIYNNGVLKYSAAVADGSFDTSGAVSENFGAGSYSGSIDDFKIYNVALNADQVMKLYQASRNGYQQELIYPKTFLIAQQPASAPSASVPSTFQLQTGGSNTFQLKTGGSNTLSILKP